MCIDPFRSRAHTHRDHRMSGHLAIDSVLTYSWSPLHFSEQISEEGLEPHLPKEIYLWGSERPDLYIDITETVELKAEALSKHVSQMRSPETMLERVRSRSLEVGDRVGLSYPVEAFRRIEVPRSAYHWAEY